MARIQVVEPEEASGELRAAYARIAAARGRIANVWKAESSNPAAMDAHLGLYTAIMYGRSGLTRRQREMIAMTVSDTNGCRYCTTHHTEALLAHLKDPSTVRAIRANFATASIEAKDRAMLEYATKLARTPSAVTDAESSGCGRRVSRTETSSTRRW